MRVEVEASNGRDVRITYVPALPTGAPPAGAVRASMGPWGGSLLYKAGEPGTIAFRGLTADLALSVWLAILLTVIGGGILGGVIERILIRPMLGESPISVFMVTVGLSSVLIGLVEFVWGSDPAARSPSRLRKWSLARRRGKRLKSPAAARAGK